MFVSCQLFAFALAVLVPSLPISAQKYVPKTITFAGTSFSQEELLAVSGLRPGEALGQPEIQAAAQKLDDTGLFSNIRFSFDGQELRYTLTPVGNLAPVVYANFPWWDSASLTAAVAAKVPLFHGFIPAESGLQQEVVAALTQMLAEKGIQATITAVPANDLATGRMTGVDFQIVSPPVQVGAVTLTGASASFTQTVADIERAAAGQDFNAATEPTLATALNAVYHRKGYLDEALSSFAHGAPQAANGKVLIPVTASITEGAQYRVAALTPPANGLIAPQDFAKMVFLHPGDVANEDLLRDTLAMVSGAYKARGYMDAKIDATPARDASAHTVSYAVSVDPGPVYHMGQLALQNVSDEQRAEILRVWPLHAGDVYNVGEVASFLVMHKKELHSLDGWSATWKAFAHEDTHIVDVVVTFRQGGPLG